MNIPGSDLLLLLCNGMLVAFHVHYLVRRLWNQPLDNGPGFFLGTEVPPGFYAGPGLQWLKRYRAMLVLLHTVSAALLATILVSGRIYLSPVWAGSNGILFPASLIGFRVWARRVLGGDQSRPSNIAVALEARRLGDYISWPAEALYALIISLSWLLILMHGDAQTGWATPAVLSYVIMGLFPGKLSIVRNSRPLPAVRTEEHHRLIETHRRYSLCVFDGMQWFLLVVLAGYALEHGWPAAKTHVWLRPLGICVALGVWLVMVSVIVRGQRRLAAMGRDLRPFGSWPSPYRTSGMMPKSGLIWFGTYIAGLMLLLAFVFIRG